MRIALYVDNLIGFEGSTRLEIELANSLNADIITAGYNPKINDWMRIKGKVIDLGNRSSKFSIPLSYFFEAPLRFLFCKNFKYDLHIFSGNSTIYAARKTNNNMLLCLTPDRFFYDLKQWKLKNSGLIRNIVFRLYIYLFQNKDQEIIKNYMRTIVSISKNVQKRVKKYYGRSSFVIYPQFDTKRFKFDKFGDYFLAVSRLMPEKRMDLIATAFTNMPDKKLVIVGNGPENNKIRKIINGHKNISLLNNVQDEKLHSLYGNCLATIYMPIDEDFGFIPLEGMASGKICVAADEGGCKETVVDKKTGFLIPASESSIINTVSSFKASNATKMKDACIKQAQKFDTKVIHKQWKQFLSNQFQGTSRLNVKKL